MTSKQSRNLGWGIVALVGFAAVMVWFMAQPTTGNESAEGDDNTETQDAPPSAPVAAPLAAPSAPAPVPAAPAPAAVVPDPGAAPAAYAPGELFAGPMPDFMAAAQVRVLDKKPLEISEQKDLYDFGKANPKDARPQLLLAWDSMNRDWQGLGVRAYRIAYRADHRAKDDPSMLRDLLNVAANFDGVEGSETTELVKEAFGREALPKLDEALAKIRGTADTRAVARLEALRTAITGH